MLKLYEKYHFSCKRGYYFQFHVGSYGHLGSIKSGMLSSSGHLPTRDSVPFEKFTLCDKLLFGGNGSIEQRSKRGQIPQRDSKVPIKWGVS